MGGLKEFNKQTFPTSEGLQKYLDYFKSNPNGQCFNPFCKNPDLKILGAEKVEGLAQASIVCSNCNYFISVGLE